MWATSRGLRATSIYGEFEWLGREFRLVDTGGIVPDDPELIPTEIYNQAQVALKEADALILVVDARTELASPDYDLVRMLLRGGKPLFLAVNKVEGEAMAYAAENFRQLGIRNVYAISSEHGLGIGDLLEAIAEAIPAPPELPIEGTPAVVEEETEKEGETGEERGEDSPDELPLHRTHGQFEQYETSVAIIGRPNVGKSTLLNALTRTSRAIVSPVAGTTRDAVDELVEFEGAQYRFVDTAGIRRKGKTHLMAEKMSVVMARRHLEAADVALLVLGRDRRSDWRRRHHRRLCPRERAQRDYRGKQVGCGDHGTHRWQARGGPRGLRETTADSVEVPLSYAPVIFSLSALEGTGPEGKGMARVLHEVKAVAEERRKRVTTGQMNRFLEKVDFQRAPVPMAKRIRIFYMTQAAVAPPTFVLFTDRDIKLHFAFERFLENQITRGVRVQGDADLVQGAGAECGR